MKTFSSVLRHAIAHNDRTDENSLWHTAQIEKLNRSYQDIRRKIARGTATEMMRLKAVDLDRRIKELQAALVAGQIAPRSGRGVARKPTDPTRKHGKGQHLSTDIPVSEPKAASPARPAPVDNSLKLPATPWSLVKLGRGYKAKRRNEYVPKPEATANGKPTISVSDEDTFL